MLIPTLPGTTADAFTLFERLENKLDENQGTQAPAKSHHIGLAQIHHLWILGLYRGRAFVLGRATLFCVSFLFGIHFSLNRRGHYVILLRNPLEAEFRFLV